jgi:hypothetical protein
MQLFQQSSIVERGSAGVTMGQSGWTHAGSSSQPHVHFHSHRHRGHSHAIGTTEIETAADAARALAPVAGRAAGMVFAIGLLGASMLAAAVLPLATS